MQLESGTGRKPPGDGGLRLSQVAAVAAGNGLEFYDFLVYSTFAIYIGRAYFPTHDAVASLLLSLATFGIGFVTRPIGGIVIGRLGDRIGRKPAMLLSFALMAVALLGLALTPTYAQIGPAAPVLAVLFRLIQGFALGGEVGPSTAFLVETATPGQRGFYGAMQSASQGVAILGAALVGVLLTFVLPPAALADWGWRLAFALGLLIVPFGLIVRNRLPESDPPPRAATPPGGLRRLPWRLILAGLGLVVGGTINTYVSTYMTTYAIDTLHLPVRAAFGSGLILGVETMVFAPLGGWLSDRIGRRALMIPAFVALIVLPAPLYWLLIAHPSPGLLYAVTAVLTAPLALYMGAALVAVTESLPFAMRCLATGLIYALATSVFGGTTQVMVAWLLHAFNQPMAPAYYRIAASVVGLIAALGLPESAPAKLRAPAGAPAFGTA